MGSDEVTCDVVESKKSYHDKEGKPFKYKLAWQEEDGKWCTALGNNWLISSSLLIFSGSHGDILLSPHVKYVVK